MSLPRYGPCAAAVKGGLLKLLFSGIEQAYFGVLPATSPATIEGNNKDK
jgi:hypothetical protein